MKIAINTRFLIKDHLEGIGWFTYEVLKRIVEQHPKDEFIFFFDRPYHEEFIFGENVKPIVLFPPARHPFLWYLWFEWSLAKALKKHKPDVFFSPDNYLSLNSTVKTLLAVHDVAIVHFPNEVPFIARKYYQHFVPKFLKRADQIITISNFVKNDMIEAYQVDPDKITLTCNGCREDFKPISKEEQLEIRNQYAAGEEYFFYIGSINPRKNIHRLIQAFDLFKSETKSSMKLLLGGRFGWQTGKVKSAFEQSRHKDDIVFLGFLKNEESPKLMAAAKALTYVSVFEGFGIPLLEAMHSNTPVITSKVASMPEVAGDAALLVNPTNLKEIAAAMKKINDDEALRQKLIEAGKIQRQKYNWQKAADAVYESLVELHQRTQD